jgi:hypothetical protein
MNGVMGGSRWSNNANCLVLPNYEPVNIYASETWTLTKRDRKQLNIFERKVYRRILGPVYDNEKENWRILTNKEIYASVKNLL